MTSNICINYYADIFIDLLFKIALTYLKICFIIKVKNLKMLDSSIIIYNKGGGVIEF